MEENSKSKILTEAALMGNDKQLCNEESALYCLSIIGQIEGHYTLSDGQKSTKQEHIVPLLVEVDESDEIAAMLSQEGTCKVQDAWKIINERLEKEESL